MTESTTHYTVLARRYRPQTFDDVIGQQNVAQALRNAILGERVAHAYLFTGARGVGKTSMARILAKALNCPNSTNAVPCNECEVCTGISHGGDVDVMEIDGASNTGVDDIRTLRANVNVKSMRTRFKLYIIDEVHMLSRNAFNALLKTLEEPPPKVKFVFCTTEPNKLPDTILSRCQRFDFATIESSSIVERLHQIAVTEGYTVDPDALELVARRAAGSMRDSQSLFDQLLAFGEEQITSSDVHKLLGTASDDRLVNLAAALISRDRAAALDRFDRALAEGVQLGELIGQMIEYCRDLMIIAAGAESVALLSVAASAREALQQQAKAWGLETIVAAMEILAEARVRMSRVTFGRAIAELALIRVSMLQDLSRIDELVKALNAGVVQALPAQKKSLTVEQSLTTDRAVTDRIDVPASPLGSVSTVPAPSAVHDSTSNNELQTPAPSGTEPVQQRGASPEDSAPASRQQASAAPSASAPLNAPQMATQATEATVDKPSGTVANSVPITASSALPSVAETPATPTLDCPQPTVAIALEAGREEEFMTQLVDSIHDMTQTHVRGASNLAISGPNGLELSFPKGYHFSKTYCERPEVKLQLERVASAIAGRDVRVSLKLIADDADAKPQPTPQVTSKRIKYPDDDEFVQQALSVFGATIVKVEGISGPVPSEDMNP